MPSLPPAKTTALALCGAGVALHLYTALFKAERLADPAGQAFMVGLVLVSCLPYAIAAVLARGRRVVWGLGAAAACLAGDMFMHHSVFIAPKGSTAAIGLLFMPFYNLLLIGPAGAVLFWLAAKLMARRPGKGG